MSIDLAAELARIAAVTAAKDAEIERLRAEVAGLREDAERYRWLTEDHPKLETRNAVCRIAMSIDVRGKGHIDAAIDAARKVEA